ncbi:MAG: S9 family peptidase [Kordiimonadaceae bacterium]|nr:S9 family peptidase [Kordiimonadaceae bacterium]MBT6032302.1 S9 family peptidase [Kordiimonadaceae bacterium]
MSNKILSYFSIIIFILSTSYIKAQEFSTSAEAFGVLPELSQVRISPDGDRVLMLQNVNGQKILVTRSLTDPTAKANGIPFDGGEYDWAVWKTNDQIIAQVRKKALSSGKTKFYVAARLVVLDWNGDNTRRATREKYDAESEIVDILKDDPDHILIKNVRRRGEFVNKTRSIYRLNLKTKDTVKEFGSTGPIQIWYPDKNHQFRYGVGFTDDPDVVYISHFDENNWKSFYYYDVNKKEKISKVIENDDFDIESITIDKDGKLESYTYFDQHLKIKNFDPISIQLDKIFEKSFPNTLVRVISETTDRDKFILKTTSPADPGTFYLFDFNTKKIELLGYNYRQLDTENLPTVEPITYEARDGLTLHGFVTIPKGKELKNLPTIILPHSDVGSHDAYGFDQLAQFISSKGYAVLQMNYRGSTGYGNDFKDKGDFEWANKVLNDITDGTNWMISQGYTDPDNICIVGKHYAGYVALQTVVNDPHLFKCSIAYVPVTNLKRDWGRGYQRSLYNNPNFSPEDQEPSPDKSPIENVDKINNSVLLLFGGYRFQSRVETFYEKMKKASKDITYIDIVDHRYRKDRDSKEVARGFKIKFLQETEKFLAKHLKEN